MSYLRLLRITNLPTAAADVVGGFFISAGPLAVALLDSVRGGASYGLGEREKSGVLGGYLPAWVALVSLVLAGCCLYLSGMADNDVRHVAKDTVLKKRRPIVDGSVTLDGAAFVRTLLTFLGVLFASVSAIGLRQDLSWVAMGGFVIALAITVFSRAYNAANAGRMVDFKWIAPTRKQAIAGLFLIGGCRALNVSFGVLLGTAVMVASGGSVSGTLLSLPVLAMLLTSFAYFFLLTRLSLLEDHGGKSEQIRTASTLMTLAVFAGPVVLYVDRYEGFRDARFLSECLPALGFLVVLLFGLWARMARAITEPTAPNVGKCIGWGIAGWPMVLAAMVMLTGSAGQDDVRDIHPAYFAGAVAAMMPMALLLRRWSAAT